MVPNVSHSLGCYSTTHSMAQGPQPGIICIRIAQPTPAKPCDTPHLALWFLMLQLWWKATCMVFHLLSPSDSPFLLAQVYIFSELHFSNMFSFSTHRISSLTLSLNVYMTGATLSYSVLLSAPNKGFFHDDDIMLQVSLLCISRRRIYTLPHASW